MCSILLTNKQILNFDDVNFFLKFRGPDNTTIYEKNGVTFVHNLLSICGEFTPQPFICDNIISIYNGEIYNYTQFGEFSSDGLCIIPAYEKYGDNFTKELDGEFAIVVVDFNKNQMILSTDTFSTKPLWYCIEDDKFGISSYKSPLIELGFKTPIKVKANSILKFDLTNNTIFNLGEVYKFDINQYKENFDDWIIAFENSIRKRTLNLREKIFVGLSSGYDSGAIICELGKQHIDYHTYTVLGKENMDIVKLRINDNYTFITPTKEIWDSAHSTILSRIEHYKYTICSSTSSYNEFHLSLCDDSGANGLSMVCERAHVDGIKIYLSGMGADEIFSDYGFNGNKIYPHSNFGGLFPKDLGSMFPWNSFYGSSMESYLAKEEYVSGAYGIEGRYPFLDKYVVQEFLWLTSEIKNSEYKSVLDNYLTTNNYPYIKNQKIGF